MNHAVENACVVAVALPITRVPFKIGDVVAGVGLRFVLLIGIVRFAIGKRRLLHRGEATRRDEGMGAWVSIDHLVSRMEPSQQQDGAKPTRVRPRSSSCERRR